MKPYKKYRTKDGYYVTFWLLNWRIFSLSVHKNEGKNGWFRLFGIGLAWKLKTAPLLFSERRVKKPLIIGKYRIKYLKRIKIK